MSVLDSHIEALAYNYVGFDFFTLVNNLWTWVAVMTAAVSFWRLRAAGSVFSSSCPLESDSAVLNSDGSQPALKLTPSEMAVEPPSSSTSETVVSSVCDCNVVDACGVTKGRFTMYYGEASENESRFTVTKEWNNGGGFDVFGVGEDELMKMVRMRMGDDMAGWYRFQDFTVLNGNVVKLWDGGRMRSSSTSTTVTTTTLECVMWL